jgi:hypothetical protein
MSKQISYSNDARQKLLKGVDKLANAAIWALYLYTAFFVKTIIDYLNFMIYFYFNIFWFA